MILPFSKEKILEIISEYPTPLYIYDEGGIIRTAQSLNDTFSWMPGYKNFYASKALPNPAIHKILKKEAGMGIDAASTAELLLAEKAGFVGEEIIFSGNNTSLEEFEKATELDVIINFDDVKLVDFYLDNFGKYPDIFCMRYNPGDDRMSGGNHIIGNPADAKYGATYEQIMSAYKAAKDAGVTRFGIHTMMVSNELRVAALVETATLMFGLASELKDKLGIELEFINLGGGFGINYGDPRKDDFRELEIEKVSQGIKQEYEKYFPSGYKPSIVTENGRFVTGPSGYLILKVRHLKDTYKHYVGTDGSMANLMRPGMYGAYHHISVLGKEDQLGDKVYDIVGSLCENNDKFAVDRQLPQVEVGDILIIHQAGAHGHAMGFNYNGKLRSAEILLKQDGSYKQIRRAETYDDLFATIDLW
jgi:diaminopimelate decarboxylase